MTQRGSELAHDTVSQSPLLCRTDLYREQAHSYKGISPANRLMIAASKWDMLPSQEAIFGQF